MKTARDYGGVERLYFKPELRCCPFCGVKLRRSHVAWRKHIITLRGIFYAVCYAYKCPNAGCRHGDILYRSSEAETLSLKYYQFSLDVVARVGHLRFRKHQTLKGVRRTLREQHKVHVSLAEVYLLSQVYLMLVNCSRSQGVELHERMRRNGGVILSIDGVQPEKGSESLYIIRDILTGETLLARNLESGDTASIAGLLEEVKALGLPVLGVISDGQRSTRLAVERVLPNVPHQLCHYHYLKNIAKPIVDMDRALKTDLKMRVRCLKTVEKKALAEGSKEAKVVLQYCHAVRSAMLDDGLYPLKPGGLRLYRRLRKVRRSMERSVQTHPHGSLSRLIKILNVTDGLRPCYCRVRRLYRLIFEARDILNQKADAGRVEAGMLRYVERLSGLRFKRLEERVAVQNILKFTRNFWLGLFHHYDHPYLPRTNNALEVYIRSLKAGYRKTTGRAGCQGYLLRYGAYIVHVDPKASCSQTLTKLKAVSYDTFQQQRRQFQTVQDRFQSLRQTRNNLDAYLRAQEKQWRQTAALQ
jgi:hypothetical protein